MTNAPQSQQPTDETMYYRAPVSHFSTNLVFNTPDKAPFSLGEDKTVHVKGENT